MAKRENPTWGVRLPPDLHTKAHQLGEEFGNKTEWFEYLMGLYENQSLQNKKPEFREDLKAVEASTKAIFTIVNAMVQRADILKEEAISEMKAKLEQREEDLGRCSTELKTALLENEKLTFAAKENEEKMNDFVKQVNDLRTTNDNNLELIKEYKEKIDTLSGLVNEYKGYKESYDKLEKQRASQVNELNSTIESRDERIKELEYQLQSQKDAHQVEIEKLTISKERELIQLEKSYQEKLTEAHDKYNEELKKVYTLTDKTKQQENKDE